MLSIDRFNRFPQIYRGAFEILELDSRKSNNFLMMTDTCTAEAEPVVVISGTVQGTLIKFYSKSFGGAQPPNDSWFLKNSST